MWAAIHKMPPAIYGTPKWDRKAIDAKLDEISGSNIAAKPQETEVQKSRRERDERQRRRVDEPSPHASHN
jgi:hypothetical protein